MRIEMSKHDKIVVKGVMIPGWVVSAILSYTTNESFFWCILHMLCSWLYVVYWVCAHSIIPNYIMRYVGL